MKKSLIKSLLPVLVVVLVLSVATISTMADTVLGPYYCPEKEGCTFYITLFDGLGRDKTPLEPSASVDYYAMGIGDPLEAGASVEYYAMGTGDALEAEAAVDYYGMRTGDALEAGASAEYWDGYHVFVQADCNDEIDGLA